MAFCAVFALFLVLRLLWGRTVVKTTISGLSHAVNLEEALKLSDGAFLRRGANLQSPRLANLQDTLHFFVSQAVDQRLYSLWEGDLLNPSTSLHPSAAVWFQRGILQLHSFSFLFAAQSFSKCFEADQKMF